ncbi:hypothetical protein [Achromobacter xylosoxidans]|uniref:hypothetical protein n=1 Tax=Alcaligenes xylosoxydans xylosoxydans TaxID=85698 RepID=UPI0011B0CC79|nr:hypothetical protein [Achromobacter xylosoxidans]
MKKSLDRITKSSDGRYTILARAWMQVPVVGLPSIMSEALVFEGEPNEARSNWKARLGGNRVTDDLLDAVENAERVGRDWIAQQG